MGTISDILSKKKDGEIIEIWCVIEGGGIYKGYEYLVVFTKRGVRCGYVALPKDSVLANVHYMDINIECHGGLTFGANDHGLKELVDNPGDETWLGFDCGHSWDKCDKEAYLEYFHEECPSARFDDEEGTIRSLNYAINECKKIIEQLVSGKVNV